MSQEGLQTGKRSKSQTGKTKKYGEREGHHCRKEASLKARTNHQGSSQKGEGGVEIREEVVRVAGKRAGWVDRGRMGKGIKRQLDGQIGLDQSH